MPGGDTSSDSLSATQLTHGAGRIGIARAALILLKVAHQALYEGLHVAHQALLRSAFSRMSCRNHKSCALAPLFSKMLTHAVAV
jgi:hypothetical protein